MMKTQTVKNETPVTEGLSTELFLGSSLPIVGFLLLVLLLA